MYERQLDLNKTGKLCQMKIFIHSSVEDEAETNSQYSYL